MELDFYDELDKQEQENENSEYWEQQYGELQIKYDCLMEAFKIQKDILTSKNKTINKAIEYIETHQLDFKKGITTFGSERLSMEERKLLDLLRGDDNDNN